MASGDPGHEIELETTVNGAPVRRRVVARQHLADFLREELGLTGTHLGCEHGVCGACTVVVDGRIVRGCLTLAVQVAGATVETIEGLSERGALAALQAAFAARNAAQCGFCTAGMLLTARELVAAQEAADRPCTRDDIRAFLSGNLCRCTGYHAIVDAVEAVLKDETR